MTTIYALFSAGITFEHCHGFLRQIYAHCKEKDNTVYIAMNSEGGDIDAGIAMFNFLRLLPTRIVTHNVGGVNSVANAMFLAGEHRLCNPSSAFGYHSSGFAVDPNTRVDIRLVREWLEKLRVNNQRLATIFAERTCLDKTTIDDLFETEQIMPAAWALDHGVVHEIKTFEIPDWLAYAG